MKMAIIIKKIRTKVDILPDQKIFKKGKTKGNKFVTHRPHDLTAEQVRLLPTAHDIAQFQKTGWYKSPVVLSDELLDHAMRGVRAFHQGERDWTLENTSRIGNDDCSSDKAVLNNEMTSLQKKEIRDLLNAPILGAITAKLAETNSIRLFADALIAKRPFKGKHNPGIVGWHADRTYWPTCSSHDMITMWIPLQDCTIDMGPVFYIEESHKWKDDLRFRNFYNFNNQNLSGLDDFLLKEKPNSSSIPMTLKKGQISVHHGYTIHASRPNTTTRDRIALAVHLQDEDNHYVPAFHPDGNRIEIGYDLVCRKDARGNPDYSDPAVFPTLFRFQ